MTLPEKSPTKAAVIAGFVTIYLVWGSTYLGIKVAVETIPPFLMAASRFLVAGLFLAGWVTWNGGLRATRKQWIDNALIGALLLLGGNGLVAWAELKIPSGITTLIVSLGPLFIVLLDWGVLVGGGDTTRGSKPTGATLLGVGLGIVGLIILVDPSKSNGQNSLDLAGVGGLVLACFSWSAGSIYSRYARQPADPFTAAAIQMLTGGVWLLGTSVLLREPTHFDLAAVSSRSLFAWVYLVVVGSLVGFTTFVWLMKHCTPARVSTYAYVNPVVAVFLGWLVADEPVGPRMFVAAAIILTGVAIINYTKSKPLQPAAPARAGGSNSEAPKDSTAQTR